MVTVISLRHFRGVCKGFEVAFRIVANVYSNEWQLARETRNVVQPGSLHDTFVHNRTHVLWGELQLFYGTSTLFPQDGLDTLLDEFFDRPEITNRKHTRAIRAARMMPSPHSVLRLAPIEALIERGHPHLASGIVASTLEFVLKLSDCIDSRGLDLGERASVIELSGHEVRIGFQERAGQVIISSNLLADTELVVPKSDFYVGVRTFFDAYLFELKTNCPELLDWECFLPLWDYLKI